MNKFAALLLAAAGLCLATVDSATAQEGASGALEEVTVTAQKRAESLQDVSVSVQVTTGQALLDSGVKGFEELSTTLPAVNISKGGASDQMYIRGIGSGFNGGFEQAVGTYIDGVYVGRSRGTRASFVDLDRIEVLKGPQSALFGNSSIAGALSVTTASPRIDDGFSGHVIATAGEYGERNIEAALNVPVSETFALRAAFRKYDLDGYVVNTFTGADVGSNDDTFYRIGALWEPTDSLSVLLKHSEGKSKSEATFVKEAINCPSTFSDRIRPGQPAFDPSAPAPGAATTCLRQQDLLDNEVNYELQATPGQDLGEAEYSSTSLEINWDFDSFTLTSITGRIDNEIDEAQDLDSGPLNIFPVRQFDTVEQTSQEIRLTSNGDGDLEWIVGAYWQDEEIDFVANQMPYMIGPPADRALGGGPLGACRVGANTQYGGGDPNFEGVCGYNNNHEQKLTTTSAFANLTYHVNDSNRLIASLRWIEVEKDLNRFGGWRWYESSRLNPAQSVPNTAFIPPDALGNTTFGAEYSDSHSASWDDVLPSVTWERDLNEDAMAYFSFNQGFKAGGFNFSSRFPSTDPSFDEETVDNFELGLKTMLLDGRLRVNVNAFLSQFEGVQQSALQPGTFTFVVGNASESESKGLELDVDWAASDSLTLKASMTFLDAEFKDFDGPCNVYQRGNLLNMLALGETGTFDRCTGTRVDDPSTNAPREIIQGFQDLAGHPTTFAPEYSGFISAVYTANLTDSLILDVEPSIYFTDSYFIQQDFDPFTEQDSYSSVNLRIALSSAERDWSVALIGKNLTDEQIIFFANDLPAGGGSYVRSLKRPQTWALQASYAF
ncbi:MAG: TonB-dependent receptor [Halieaceae bacterium]